MEKFELGDVVTLVNRKEVPMTIEGINKDSTYSCIWFEGKELFRDIFNGGNLQLIKPKHLL